MMLHRRNQPVRRLALGLLLTLAPSVAKAEIELTAAGPQTPEEPTTNAPAVLDPASIQLEASAELIGTDALPTEKVQERYPSRTLKTERFVAQDEAGNYFNHGKFTQWAEDGRMAGRGEFRRGHREGKWTRWFSISETETAFPHLLELGFEAPFTSQATFADGKMHGTWTIVDARKRQVAAWEFENGNRHGMSLWWFPAGSKFREVEYRSGELDGIACEYAATGEVVKEEKFVDGYCHAVLVEHYLTGEVKSECETLFAKDVLQAQDDFWTGKTAVKVVGKIGRDQRHGRYVAWNKAGEKILSGTYVDDQPHGKFIWWHANGNKAIEGSYIEGKQDGMWTWWYENGLKEIAGEYSLGNEGGNWRQWTEEGRIAETLQILPLEYNGRGPLNLERQPTLAPPQSASADETPVEAPEPVETLRQTSFDEVLNQVTAATQLMPVSAAEPILEVAPPPAVAGEGLIEIDTTATPAPVSTGPVLKPVAPRE